MFAFLAYIDEGCNIVIFQGDWELVTLQIKPFYCRMLSFGKKKIKPFLFLICFISYRQMDRETKNILSHSSLLKVSEDVCESAQPSVQPGDGFGSFYMSLPQDRGISA